MQTALTGHAPTVDPHAAVLAARISERIASGKPLGRIGPLEVRLAHNEREVAAAQQVRYRVFYEELGAGTARDGSVAIDADRFDAICDHLLVIDTARPGPDSNRIVGTYRLLRQETAAEAGGFYSEDEFELRALVSRHPTLRFLELGRSCVLPEYRSKRTIEVLWQGIWSYINHYGIDVMTGCASFHGVVPAAHAEALSYLAQNHVARGAWSVRAVRDRRFQMDLMPSEAISAKNAIAAMPPLIKGYLRIGATFGEDCVIDHDFGTVDVFVILPVEAIGARYINYYAGEAERFAA